MKNIIQILVLITGLHTANLLAGNPPPEKLDFNISLIDHGSFIDVVVTVTSGEPEFTYSIWDGTPWEEGKELYKSEKTTQSEYTFRNMESKAYIVIVADKNDLRRVKQAQLNSDSPDKDGQ